MQNSAYLRLLVISMALQVSVLIYLFVPFFLAGQDGYQQWHHGFYLNPQFSLLVYVFIALGLMMTVLSILVPKLFGKNLGALSAPNQPIGTPPASGVFLDFSQVTPQTTRLTIMRLAFAESIAIFGLVLAMLHQAPLWVVPFGIWAVLLQFILGPIAGKMFAPRSL